MESVLKQLRETPGAVLRYRRTDKSRAFEDGYDFMITLSHDVEPEKGRSYYAHANTPFLLQLHKTLEQKEDEVFFSLRPSAKNKKERSLLVRFNRGEKTAGEYINPNQPDNVVLEHIQRMVENITDNAVH